MKKMDVILGLVMPWVLILFGIPVGTYYISALFIRCIYIFLITFSASILFRLALNYLRNRDK